MIWAQLAYPICAGYGGRDSACISGHALHLVVHLVLEKVPGRLPCPFIMRLGTFSKRGGTGITNRRLASKVGVGELTANGGLLCSLRRPAAAPAGVLPSPGSSEDKFNLSGTHFIAPCPYPFDLPSVRDQ